MSKLDFYRDFAGMEDLETSTSDIAQDAVLAEASVANEQVQELTEQVQELAEEVAEVSEDVEDQQEQIEELEETVEEIEGTEGLFNGNYNGLAAKLLYAKGIAAYNRLNPSKPLAKIEGNESFRDASSAQAEMRDGLESFKDTIKNWYDKAVAFIKRIWDAIYNFVVGLFNKAKALRNRANKVKEALNKKGFKSEVKLGRWNSFVDLEKAKDGLNKVVDGLDKVTLDSLGAALANDIKTGQLALASTATAYKKLASEFTNIPGAKSEKSDGNTTKVIIASSGINLLVRVWHGNVTSAADLKSAFKATRFDFTRNTNVKTEGEVKIKGKENFIKGLLTEVDLLINTVSENSKISKLAKQGAAKFISDIKSANIATGTSDKTTKDAIGAATAFSNMCSAIVLKIGKLAGASADAYLDCVMACVKK